MMLTPKVREVIAKNLTIGRHNQLGWVAHVLKGEESFERIWNEVDHDLRSVRDSTSETEMVNWLSWLHIDLGFLVAAASKHP